MKFMGSWTQVERELVRVHAVVLGAAVQLGPLTC